MTHYVYAHVDPRTLETTYVGRGTGQRAWMVTHRISPDGKYGHRGKDHEGWLLNLFNEGYTMEDIVSFIGVNMSKEESKILETIWIKKIKPRFNYLHNKDDRRSKIKNNDLLRIRELRASGMYYSQIAQQEGISTMAIWRAINERL